MKILVTGAAGFIGFYVCRSLIAQGHIVVGIDNINDYYEVDLKFSRLWELGIPRENAQPWLHKTKSQTLPGFSFIRMRLEDREALPTLFRNETFEVVCHLAAQARVRQNIENPWAYIDSNIVGFTNILECCRQHGIKHLVYASSSSVYGSNRKIPFEVSDVADHPVSLYAATKKSNELMAHTYSHLYGLPTTGLRFFTVYGPWGRPDMAPMRFTRGILNEEAIKVFNQGDMARDFTYVEDIASGILKVIQKDVQPCMEGENGYKVYNIGRGVPVRLLDFIETLEKALGKKAIKEFLPMQPGDVRRTWADTTELQADYGYRPKTDLQEGIKAFTDWYLSYYNSD